MLKQLCCVCDKHLQSNSADRVTKNNINPVKKSESN